MFADLRFLQVLHGRPEPGRNGQPGREHEGREKGYQHRRRSQGRNGLHVRSHHARDEAHRQQCRDDGEGGKDGRIAHFADCIHRDVHAGGAFLEPAPVNVLDDHDGVIDQDADGEDEREEADPVDGVAGLPGKEDGHQQDHGDDQDHHNGGAEGEKGQQHQNEDEACGLEQLADQLVDFVFRGFPVVAGYRNLHVAGDHPAHEIVHPLQHRARHTDAVGALLLGDGDGHRRHTLDRFLDIRRRP